MTSVRIITNPHSIVNVASVPQRSPFRYPGGKTWLVPHVRHWLASLNRRPRVFVEPFAGGAITGLTVAAENLARQVVLGELDEAVASVWQIILGEDVDWLMRRILDFEISRENVMAVLNQPARSLKEIAFHTILRNRVQRGGILAPGASLVKQGENGRGVASRWYPETLARRISAIAQMRQRISFVKGDGFRLIERYHRNTTAAFFVDPPYTAGGKKAGSRLYTHTEIDHERLFALISQALGPFMLTYDDAPEVRQLAGRFRLQVEAVPMKNTHHEVMHELVITNIGSCLDLEGERRFAAAINRQFRDATSRRNIALASRGKTDSTPSA